MMHWYTLFFLAFLGASVLTTACSSSDDGGSDSTDDTGSVATTGGGTGSGDGDDSGSDDSGDTDGGDDGGTTGGSTGGSATNDIEAAAISVSAKTSTTLDIAWTAPAESIAGYRLAYKPGGEAPVDCDSDTVVDEGTLGTGTSHSLSGLDVFQEYAFRLCTIDDDALVSAGIEMSTATRSRTVFFPSGLDDYNSVLDATMQIASHGGKWYIASEFYGVFTSTDNGANYANFSAHNGMVSGWTTAIDVVDGKDIYVATIAGLAVSSNDGQSFANRTTADGLPSNNLTDVAADNGLVAVASAAGVGVSTDGVVFAAKTTADGLGSNSVNEVEVNGSHVFACTANGLAVSSDQGATFTNKTTADGLESNTCLEAFYADGTLYVGTDSGWNYSTDDGGSFSSPGSQPVGTNIRGFAFDGVNLYIGHNAGVSITSDSGASYSAELDTGDGLSTNNVRDVGYEGGYLLVASPSGFDYSSDMATFTSIVEPHQFGGEVAVDESGGTPVVYSGTNLGAGFYVSTDGGATFTNKGPAMTVNDISVSGSTVYVATPSGIEVSTDQGDSFTTLTTAQGLPSNIIESVCADGVNIYVVTFAGISVSNDSGASFNDRTVGDGLGHGAGSKCHLDGTTLYIATDNGVSVSTDSGASFTNSISGMSNTTISSVFAKGLFVVASAADKFYISTDGGTTFAERDSGDGLEASTIDCVYYSDDLIIVGYALNNQLVSVSADGGGSFSLGSETEVGFGYLDDFWVTTDYTYFGSLIWGFRMDNN